MVKLQEIIKKQCNKRGFILFDMKNYYKFFIILQYYYRKKKIDQWNKIGSLEIYYSICGDLLFDKSGFKLISRNIVYLINDVGIVGYLFGIK